jgi:hypothetical protein
MRFLLVLLLSVVSGFAVDADLYVNFEGVSAGTAASASIMGTISKTNGNAVTFSYVGTSTGISVENDTVHPGLLAPVKVAGASYTNSSPTKALYVQPDVGGDGNLQKLLWTYAASRKVSCGFSITMTNFGSAATAFYNCGGFETGGDYGVVSMVADSTVPYIQAEDIGGTGADVLIGGNGTSHLTIWVTLLWDSANSKFIAAFYNQTNMSLMGFSTRAITLNATVNTMGWGGTAAHTYAANENYYLNNLILYTNGNVWPVWPGTTAQVPTNSSGAAITQAISLMSNGDTLFLPATNITITSGITFNKTSSTMTSVLRNQYGTNKTTILADGVIDAFTISGDYNVVTNFAITGDGANDEATGIVSSGAHNRYGWMYLSELAVGFYAQNNGLMHDSTILDCAISARNIFGDAYFTTYGPRLAYNSTNQMVYEDMYVAWGAGKNATGSNPLMSSQEGQAWMFRHSTCYVNRASCDLSPAFDFHGDWDPGSNYMPGLLLQIYKIDLLIGASGISGAKYADIRGWESDIHSNKVWGGTYDADKGINYREEHLLDDAIPWVVTNSFNAYNFDNGGAHTMAVSITSNTVVDGINFSNALSGQTKLAYPHPDRGIAAAAPPDYSATAVRGQGRPVNGRGF